MSKSGNGSVATPPTADYTQQRAKLQKELDRLDNAVAYVTTTEQSDEIDAQRKPIIEQLRKLDEAEGKTGVYTGGDRLKNALGNAKLATQQGLTRADHSITQTVDMLIGDVAKHGKALVNATLQTINPNWGFEDEDPWITRRNKRGAEVLAQNDAIAQQRIEEGRLNKTAWKYAPEVVAAIPDVVLAYFTGGASAGATATRAGLEAASAIAQGSSAAQKLIPIADATKNMMKSPAWMSAFAQSAGGSYEEALADGATEAQANLYALLNGFANATIEVGGSDEAMGGIQKLPQQLRDALEKGNKSAVMQWVKSTAGEAKEEVLQGMAEKGLRGLYTNDVPLYSATDENAVINPKRAKEEALGGLIVGGVLGGGQMAIQSAINSGRVQNANGAQTAQEAQNVQRDIPAAPKTENMRTADSGALNAALETIGAVTRAGGSTESAMKLLSPKQIEAYNNYRAKRKAAEEAANKPATPKAKNVTGDELAALDKALKGYDEQTRNDIIEEYRKVVEGKAPTSFEAKVNREAARTAREAEAREKGIEVFKPTYDEDALDIAEKRVAARKEAKYQDKKKSVATAENSEYDDTRFKFDYDAARKKAEKAYDLELKRWYEEHPNESEPDPDSWLSDKGAYVSEYVRRLSRIELAEHKKANELISKAQFRDRNLGKTEETHQETRQDDYRRDDEAYKDNVDEDWDTNSRRTDISGNKVDVYGTRSISRGTFRSDAEAPPVTAAERRYAKLMGKERADSIEKREAARAAVTENATERMERMAAENKLLRKVVEAKTEEERASAQEEYKKFKDNEAANLAAKNGGENDVHRIRYDEVRGRPGLESGDRGNIENVRRDAGSRELGRLSEVVRHADPAERGQRLEEAGYKIINERERSSEEVKASKIVNDLVGDDVNVVILAGEGIDIGLAHTESDGRRTIFLVRKPNSRYRMEDVAVHEAAHIRMPEGIKSNAHQYAKYLLLNNGFT